MKRLVFLSSALFLVTGAALSQGPPIGYMGLYADADHTICEVFNTGGIYLFEMWVWCLSSDHGMMCSEFRIGYPPNVIQSTTTWSPRISVTLGDLPSGLSACYIACQWDWTWIVHQTILLLDSQPTFLMIAPHPDVGLHQFANCEPGYPIEPVTLLTNLALNQSCAIGTENVSWGAIKSLFRR